MTNRPLFSFPLNAKLTISMRVVRVFRKCDGPEDYVDMLENIAPEGLDISPVSCGDFRIKDGLGTCGTKPIDPISSESSS